MKASRLVVGIGNVDRGDDGAGVMVARGLDSQGALDRRDCSDLLELFELSDDVVVVDAMKSGRPPGTVVRLNALVDPLPANTPSSTHGFGVSETVEIARRLGRLPGKLTIIAIEAGTFEWGVAITNPVKRAVESVISDLESGTR